MLKSIFNTKRISAYALASSLAITPFNDTKAIEPMTIMAGISLLNAALSMNGPKSSVAMELSIAQFETLKAMNARLDQSDKILSSIYEEVLKSAERQREIATTSLNTERSESVLGDVASLYEAIAAIKNHKASPQEVLAPFVISLQRERNSLFKRPDHVAMVIVHAYVAETLARKVLKQSPELIKTLSTNAYAQKFDEMLDPKRPASLAWMYAALQEEQEKAETEIISQIAPGEKVLTTRTLEPVRYTHHQTRQEDEEYWYKEPFDNAGMKDYGRSFLMKGLRKKDVPFFTGYELPRTLSVTPLDRELKIYRIAYNIALDKPAITPNKKFDHAVVIGDEGAHRSTLSKNYDALQQKIASFNARAEYMAELAYMQRVVLITRKNMDNFDKHYSQKDMIAAKEFKYGDARDRYEDSKLQARSVKAGQDIEALRKAGVKSWEIIDKHEKKIDEARKEAAAHAWKGEVMAYLNLASAAINFGQQVRQEMLANSLETAADITNNVKGLKRLDEKQRPSSTKKKMDEAVLEGLPKQEADHIKQWWETAPRAERAEFIDRVIGRLQSSKGTERLSSDAKTEADANVARRLLVLLADETPSPNLSNQEILREASKVVTKAVTAGTITTDVVGPQAGVAAAASVALSGVKDLIDKSIDRSFSYQDHLKRIEIVSGYIAKDAIRRMENDPSHIASKLKVDIINGMNCYTCSPTEKNAIALPKP